MQRCSVMLFSLLALAAPAALAQTDGGVEDAGVEGCTSDPAQADGGLSILGECDGNTLRFCNNQGQVVTVDCAADYFPEGQTGVCEFIADDYGFDCATGAGETCLFQDQQGNPLPVFCAGEAGCTIDVAANSATCETAPACSPDDDTFQPTCQGDNLAIACLTGGQPISYDCASAGGACTGAACTGIPQGGPCDDQTFVCADGLECSAQGACETPGAGEGEGEGEGGEGEGEDECPRDQCRLDDGTCGDCPGTGACASTRVSSTTAPAALGFLALLSGLVAVRRRRS